MPAHPACLFLKGPILDTRAYYADRIDDFLSRSPDAVLGQLTRGGSFALEAAQRDAWIEQIEILQRAVNQFRGRGKLYFEYAVPRLGRRIDVLAVIDHALFVIEFKVGEAEFTLAALDQVADYALDLKNFHESSHDKLVAPILVATRASAVVPHIAFTSHDDGVFLPIRATAASLSQVIEEVLRHRSAPAIDPTLWERGRYCPTPTIVEAAIALYAGHSVADISRSDAGATNLTRTSTALSRIVRASKADSRKSVCFVTGVPGAGKTLVGLNIATQHIDKASDLYSVFLSGNGPLVAILREALARDKVRRTAEAGTRLKKGQASSEVKLFVQNVHHFRDECLVDSNRPPIEHVALFDEAQRAWNLEQTAKFMLQRKRIANFSQSEPEFLISCLDRHPDWAVIVCLVGGGQEINTGEAGISEWICALTDVYPNWDIHISSRLQDSEYGAGSVIRALSERQDVYFDDDLHLGVSMRSFRAEHVSTLVKCLLDCDEAASRHALAEIAGRFPIVLTRDVTRAKVWLKEHARGSERYGIIASSHAQRLKPYAIDVRTPVDPIHWFLDGKNDVRSSFYLEDVATEFHVQGLELDWACVVWDGDFRFDPNGWLHLSFVADRWNRIRKAERQMYLKNAYRVLLTRARQGMVIVVPAGDEEDPTRHPSFYEPTFKYLRGIGFPEI